MSLDIIELGYNGIPIHSCGWFKFTAEHTDENFSRHITIAELRAAGILMFLLNIHQLLLLTSTSILLTSSPISILSQLYTE